MKNIQKVEITAHTPFYRDLDGESIISEIKDLGLNNITQVRTAKVYKFEGLKQSSDIDNIKRKLLVEPLWRREINGNTKQSKYVLEVALKPGVTNTEIDSIIKAVNDLGISVKAGQSGRKYYFIGNPTKRELEFIKNRILINQTTERIAEKEESSLSISGKRQKTVRLSLQTKNTKQLLKLSKERLLFLNLDEMIAIQKYFKKLGRNPTDCELETIAQTWSEHNSHKTFKAKLIIDGKKKKSLFSRLKKATQKIHHPDTLVVFSDNAGIVSFDKDYAICGKTETHNSPSALEPFGGSMTGSGGVFRDIAGTGLGAKNIASTDIFCFADPNLTRDRVPPGCLHPKRILQKCIAGVRVYGNCMGIPTVNGSLHFNNNYRAKPVVLVGAYGIIPKKFIFKKKINPADLVVSIGGKTGRDGIHGATFSSAEMSKDTEDIASSAVQIGNPIEEIRMVEALLEARDAHLIKSITDCGGGGYSSAIGEMAKDMGVKIDLALVPLKYEGLAPWEIWLSEAQERMILAIEPKNLNKLKEICHKYNTGVYPIGEFTDTQKLELVYGDELVADIDMTFLHDGIPKKILIGKDRKKFKVQSASVKTRSKAEKKVNYGLILKKILSNLNVASKEEIVRRYDHEVQGRLVLKPYIGVELDGPSDGAIIKPLFDSDKGLALAHGLNPEISVLDPYWGGIYAVDEAVRNLVALGCNPQKIFLLDNFIFPQPDKYTIGDLDRAVDGICKVALIFKTPFISGKDSLSGTYIQDSLKIEVPPTICISAMGIVDKIQKSISSDFKKPGSVIIHLGQLNGNLGGSIYSLESQFKDNIPQFNIKKAAQIYFKLYLAIQQGLILSAHDISEGGLAVTLTEMCFGGDCGASVGLNGDSVTSLLFSESGGRLLIELKKDKLLAFKKIFRGNSYTILGQVKKEKRLEIDNNDKNILNENIDELKKTWQEPFRNYF